MRSTRLIGSAGSGSPYRSTNSGTTSSAMWEEQPDADIFLIYPAGVIRFPAARYRRLVDHSIMAYRSMTAQEKNCHLGGRLLIERGLEQALRDADRAVSMVEACLGNPCLGNLGDDAPRMMESIGFAIEGKTLITGRAAREVMLEKPLTTLTLFRRRPPGIATD